MAFDFQFKEAPLPLEFQILSMVWVWVFSGITHLLGIRTFAGCEEKAFR